MAERIQAEAGWARLLVVPDGAPRERGAPIVKAIHAGVEALETQPDIVVNVDADVTMGEDYFERLVQGFETNSALGIASGSAWELVDDGAGVSASSQEGRSGEPHVPTGGGAFRTFCRSNGVTDGTASIS